MRKRHKLFMGAVAVLIVALAILYPTFSKENNAAEPKLGAVLQTDSIVVDNNTRKFMWYGPKSVNSFKLLLFVFHGSGSDGTEIRKQTGHQFDKLADKNGFVVVYPNGYKNHWNDCRASADYDSNTQNVDDIKFIKEVEKFIANKINQTFKYKFATGHSNGGQFCQKLALEAPDWINGIAPISANLPIDGNLDCNRSGVFVPIVMINGTEDKLNHYNGGLVDILGNTSRGTVLSTDDTINYWLRLGRILEKPKVSDLQDIDPKDGSTVKEYAWGNPKNPKVVLYKVIGGGHTIPQPLFTYPAVFGSTNHDLNAPEAIWRFFRGTMDNE